MGVESSFVSELGATCMRLVVSGVCAALLLAIVTSAGYQAGEGKEPKYSIEDVMKKAMKGGLCKKCASGKATEAEKKTLVAMFVALGQNTPPKGEKASWEKKTKALVDAAKAVAAGEEGAGKKLGKAANCAACHKVHK